MIIENLISNAVKYSYPESTVSVRVQNTAKSVLVTVKDKGVGLEQKDHDKIFQKFDRVQNPLSHSEGGSGLGLFLARQLARAHGGDVTVTSKIGKGSKFTLELPKKQNETSAVVNLRSHRPLREEAER